MTEIDRARIQIYKDLHVLTCENVKMAIKAKQSILNDISYPKFLTLLQELDNVTRGSSLVNIRCIDEQLDITASVQLWLETSRTIWLNAWGLPSTTTPVVTEIWPPKEEKIS